MCSAEQQSHQFKAHLQPNLLADKIHTSYQQCCCCSIAVLAPLFLSSRSVIRFLVGQECDSDGGTTTSTSRPTSSSQSAIPSPIQRPSLPLLPRTKPPSTSSGTV
eukprot:scaffold2918_cov230-Alexandrium_tamarense.AAC.3